MLGTRLFRFIYLEFYFVILIERLHLDADVVDVLLLSYLISFLYYRLIDREVGQLLAETFDIFLLLKQRILMELLLKTPSVVRQLVLDLNQRLTMHFGNHTIDVFGDRGFKVHIQKIAT